MRINGRCANAPSGRYTKVVFREPPHECRPPGAFSRWLAGIAAGSEWQCAKCQMTWRLELPLYPVPIWQPFCVWVPIARTKPLGENPIDKIRIKDKLNER